MAFLAATSAAIHLETPVRDVTDAQPLNVSFAPPTYDVAPAVSEMVEVPPVREKREVDWQRVEKAIDLPLESGVKPAELADETITLQSVQGIDLASLEPAGGGSGAVLLQSRYDLIPVKPHVPETPIETAARAGGGAGTAPIGIGGAQASGSGSGTGSGIGTGTDNGSGSGGGVPGSSGVGNRHGTGIGDGEGSGHGTGGTRPPRPKRMERGPYPSDVRRANIEGEVTLAIEVLASGKVGAIEIAESSGHISLDRAAREAATHWRFEPAEADGRAVASNVEIRYRFKLVDGR